MGVFYFKGKVFTENTEISFEMHEHRLKRCNKYNNSSNFEGTNTDLNLLTVRMFVE